MGVSYIPGPEALLAPVASQLSQAIFDAINPNAKIQKALQAAVIQNPALIQSFADIEFSAPGTLEKLGFGPIGQTFAQTPPSPEAAARPEETKARKAKAGAVTAEANYTIQDMTGLAEFIRNNPQAKVEEYFRRTTGETATERAKRPVIEAEADRRLEFLKDPKIGDVDFLEVARSFENGQLPSSEFMRYLSQPETRIALEQGFAERNFQRQQALSRWIASQRDSVRGQVTETSRVNKAYDMFQRSGNAGSLDAWETILFEPDGIDKAAELATKDVSTLSPEDRYLVEAYNASLEMRTADRQQNQYRANVEISRQMATFNSRFNAGAKDDELTTIVQHLNDALEAKGRITGKPIIAHYGPVPDEKKSLLRTWMGRDAQTDIYFTDAEGNLVNPEVLTREEAPPSDANAGQNVPGVQAAVTFYNNASAGEQQAALARWKAEDKTPNKRFYNAVIQALGLPADTTKK